jgi:hypothetical protein
MLLLQFEDNSVALFSLPYGVAFTDPKRTKFDPLATISISTRIDMAFCGVIEQYYRNLDTDKKVEKILIQ